MSERLWKYGANNHTRLWWHHPQNKSGNRQMKGSFQCKLIFFACQILHVHTLSLCCDSAKQEIKDTLMCPFGSFCDFEFVTMIHLSPWFFRHAWVYFYSCMLDPMWNVQDLFTYLSCFRAQLFPVFLFCSVVCACSLHKTSCASWVMIMMIIITSEDLKTVLSLL